MLNVYAARGVVGIRVRVNGKIITFFSEVLDNFFK